MNIHRREFLKASSLLAISTMFAPNFLAKTAHAATAGGSSLIFGKRALVVVQLSGGNDGLNTVIPYADELYYKYRPTLAIKEANVLKLDEQLGLHPSMSALKGLFDNGKLAIIRGVGYPNPNYSHFRAMEIWQSGDPLNPPRTGWIGRILDEVHKNQPDPTHPLDRLAMNFGQTVPVALWTESTMVLSVNAPASFSYRTDPQFAAGRMDQLAALNKLYQVAQDSDAADFVRTAALEAIEAADTFQKTVTDEKTQVNYPNTAIGNRLKTVSQLLSGDFGSRIFYVQADGDFDTHVNQAERHNTLLRMISEGLAAFYQDLDQKGMADDVMTMSFSEFGRRVQENGSRGTDHGSAQPMFVAGGGIKGGLYGQQPSLSVLDAGNLKFMTDFRAVYGSIVKDWLGIDPSPVVGDNYDHIALLREQV